MKSAFLTSLSPASTSLHQLEAVLINDGTCMLLTCLWDVSHGSITIVPF